MIFLPVFSPALIALIFIPILILCAVCIKNASLKNRDIGKIGWIRRLAMMLCLLIMALGPTIQTQDENAVVTDLNILFVVDTTGSMSSLDGSNTESGAHLTRLDDVKSDIITFSYLLPKSIYSAIVFNSSASLSLPATQDARALRNFSYSLTPEITRYSTGSDLSVPIKTINNTIDGIRTKYPDNKVLLIYFSDGEETSSSDVSAYSEVASQLYGGAIIGYGTPEGANMLEYSPSVSDLLNVSSFNGDLAASTSSQSEITDRRSYIKDPISGEDAISTFNPETLKKISDLTGVKYIDRRSVDDIKSFSHQTFDEHWHKEPIYQTKLISNLVVWPLEILFALLLVWELYFKAFLNFRRRSIV